MVRLSIIIPALGDASTLESSLVSVLSNRPDHCEVLVVLTAPYDDPYQLGDEVRFVEAPRKAPWAVAVNHGLEAANASIVHVLAPGVQVSEGWAHLATRHFHNPQVAAVAPLVISAGQPDRVLAAGVNYHRRGERLLSGAGVSTCAAASLTDALGPTAWAGFYRRSAVLDLLGGFDPSVGSRLADVDMALRLRAAGYRSVSEIRSQVSLAPPKQTRLGIADAFHAERLFCRNLAARPTLAALPAHARLLCGELVSKLPFSPLMLSARLIAAAQVGRHLQHRLALSSIRRQVSISLALADTDTRQVRIDEAHPTLAMTRRPARKTSDKSGDSRRAA